MFRGYTRSVGWRLRVISTVLLVVLTGLPVAGLTCAVACALDASTHASTGSAHHGPEDARTPNCDTPPTSGGVQLRGAAGHDCGVHDVTLRQASFAAHRADALLRSAAAAIESIDIQVAPHSLVDRQPLYRRPPGTDPPTRTPLVLRV